MNNKLVLTCSHNFDTIKWENRIVRYTKIFICSLDLANETLFSVFNSIDHLIEAKIIHRGLIQDDISNYDETKANTTDFAILTLDKLMKSLLLNEFFDLKLNSLSKPNDIPIYSQLFLISNNGELTNNNDLDSYKYKKGFEIVTINKFIIHCCTALRGSSGSVILDSTGRFTGIHVGIANLRK